MQSPDLLRGTIKTIVLKMLAEYGRMYGYEMTQRVKELSKGEIEITFGALYPILHKLEADDLLVTETELHDNRIRKYYELTEKGELQAQSKVEEFLKFFKVLKGLLK